MDVTILEFPLERLGNLEISLTKVVKMDLVAGIPVSRMNQL